MVQHASVWIVLLFCTTTAWAQNHATITQTLNADQYHPGDTGTLTLHIDIAPGLHAQSHTPRGEGLIPFTAQLNSNPAIRSLDPVYPPGKDEMYGALGLLNVYTGQTEIRLPFRVSASAPNGPLDLSGKLRFQICNDSMCFAPESPPFSATAKIVGGAASASTPGATTPGATTPGATQATPPSTAPASLASSTGGDAVALPTHGIVWALGSALLAGLIFNVMPCVLPVLPLKAIGFYEVSQHRRGKTFLFGLVFSAGMITVFVALALLLLAGKTLIGRQFSWGEQFSYPWFVWSMALLLALLGFGLLGAFTVNLPSSVYGLSFRHDTFTGNFLWGGLTAVLSTPCTAPLFPPLLGWALGQPLAIGMLSVVTVGVGMSLPYLLLSAAPELARKFPRAGAGAELVKQMMGFLLLTSAAFLVGGRLLGDPNQWWLVLVIIAWACLFLVVRSAQIARTAGALLIATALAIGILSAATVEAVRLTGVFEHAGGSKDLWQPYSAAALSTARDSNQIVLIDFTAAWCLNCKYIDQTVYHDPAALDALKQQNVVMLKADLTDANAPGWTLLNQLGGNGIPFTAIYSPHHDRPLTLASIYTTNELMSAIRG